MTPDILLPTAYRRNPPHRIIAAVANAYNLPDEDIRTSRDERYTWPRQVAMYFMREITGATQRDIGQCFGKDHGTVLHACALVRSRMDVYPELREALGKLRQQIEQGANVEAQ